MGWDDEVNEFSDLKSMNEETGKGRGEGKIRGS